jgi:hypothetical protein
VKALREMWDDLAHAIVDAVGTAAFVASSYVILWIMFGR